MNKNRETVFHFKQFSLSNSLSAMKVGTDGVLLGAWARVPVAAADSPVLDVGCGTGVIGLMIAQRYSDVMVNCIDISTEAVEECSGNISRSPFASRVEAGRHDFLDYHDNRKYGLIVSNPPFFTERLHSPDALRASARHDDSMPLPSLLRCAVSLLSPDGCLALVLPAARDNEVLLEASLAGLYPVRQCKVYTRRGKVSRRTLWEFSLMHSGACEPSELFIQDGDGNFTEQYKALLRDFYLHF